MNGAEHYHREQISRWQNAAEPDRGFDAHWYDEGLPIDYEVAAYSIPYMEHVIGALIDVQHHAGTGIQELGYLQSRLTN